jgi:uncharacterized protein YkwD
MKSLPFLSLLVFLALVGCAQTTTSPSATSTLASPLVIQATLTPQPTVTVFSPTATVEANMPTPELPQPTQEPTATPAAPQTNDIGTVVLAGNPAGNTANTQSGECTDNAAFFDDVTIPDGTSFKQSIPYTKTWQIRNEGTCTWDGYKLVFAGGSQMDGPLSTSIPVVKPGETANISVDLKSPPQGGLFTGLWEFENKQGKRFGVNSGGVDLIWVKISVTWYAEGETAGSSKTSAASVPVAPVGSACQVQQNQDYVNQVLALINQARAENGVPALTLQDKLSAAAFGHSQDMACNDYVDHTGSDGSSWTNRVQAQGYSYTYVSENIYVGDPTFGGDAAGAFTWWMNSDVHRRNILSTKVTSIGIGYAYYPNSTYKGYYTVNFAKP